MADEGPTTVGSIVGRLRMDRDQWVADMARTKQDARELGSLTPTVRVTASVAKALADLEAVRAAAAAVGASSAGTVGPSGPAAGTAAKVDAVAAAERRLAAAEAASEMATQRAIVAEMRLAEQREKGRRTAAQEAAQELALQAAIGRADSAAEKAALAEQALAAAQRKAAESAAVEAAAQDTSTAATVRANEANKTHVTRMGLITTAIATLIPMAVPLAAGAIGIAGAFTMMGVAGVLAVMGIKKEMADGTAVGAQYSVGLSSMRGNLDQLSRTSAVAMLSSFRGVVGDLNADMPMLNRQVGLFSGLLGQSGRNLFQGTLNGARVLEPLLLTVGVYLDRLTAKFNAWTGNGGLQRFANYAMQALPQVEEVLAAVGNAVMHILQALAPLGSVGLTILTLISNMISGMPVQVLSDLIAAITWGTLAFKAWGFVAPMLANIATKLEMTGAAATIATGPIGWVVAGVGALAAILAVSVASQRNATAAIQDYTAAVQADSGAVGENVKAKTAQKLLDEGVYNTAKKLRVPLDLVTQSVLGNTEAHKKLLAQIDNTGAGTDAYAKRVKASGLSTKEFAIASELLQAQMKKQADGVSGAVTAYKTLQAGLGKTTAATQAQDSADQAAAKSAGVSLAAYRAATSAQGDTAAQTEKTTALMYLQGDAAGLLKQQLDLLNGKTLNAAQAQNQFDSQLANMSDHMNAAGKQVNRADTLLTGMSAAAVKNRGELISLTQAAENNAQAFRDNGGSAEDTRQKLITMKQAIIDNAVAHGEDRDQVQAYIDTLFKIPDSIPATKLEVDTADALARIAAVNDAIKRIQARANLGIDVARSSSSIARANGGTVEEHDSGGTVHGPGTSKSDSVLTRLSRGEEVTPEPYATRQRGLLKQIGAGVVPAVALSRTAPAAAPARAQAPVDRPIYADGIGLIGWIRQLANGEARLVFNQGMNSAALQLSGGLA